VGREEGRTTASARCIKEVVCARPCHSFVVTAETGVLLSTGASDEVHHLFCTWYRQRDLVRPFPDNHIHSQT